MNYIEYTDDIFFCYTCPIISLIGFLLSIFCLIIFLNTQFKQNLYNYYKIEILFIAFDLNQFFTVILHLLTANTTQLSISSIS